MLDPRPVGAKSIMDKLSVETRDWAQKGCSVIWEMRCLYKILTDNSETTSVNRAMWYSRTNSWPKPLPAYDDKALVVVGLDARLEKLPASQREKWLENNIKSIGLNFNRTFQNRAGLIFLFERGKPAFVEQNPNSFLWRPTLKSAPAIAIANYLFMGPNTQVQRLVSGVNSEEDSWGWHATNSTQFT